MLLITLAKTPRDCRVELDGQDISGRLCRIEVDAEVKADATLVRLTLRDDVVIMGEAGALEFVRRDADPPSR